MKLVINIKNEAKVKQFIDFINEIPYIEIEKTSDEKSEKKIAKLPSEFYKPLKVDKYIKFNRDEIYEELLR